MKIRLKLQKLGLTACALLVGLAFVPTLTAQASGGAATVDSSTNVLNEFMAIPNQGIPRSMISKAQGLVIIPGMIKAGFIAGIRRGKGIVVIRDERGAWKPPVFATMTGGSVGWQAGIQSNDVILVFRTRKSVTGLLSGKFTIASMRRWRLALSGDRPRQLPMADFRRRSCPIHEVAGCFWALH